MRGKGILVICFVIAAVALAVALLPSGAAEAQVGGKHIVYNLFATDGYYELADNTAVPGAESATYIYGFVGGRAGQPFTYQTSYCTGDGVTRTCAASTNVTLPDAPQPAAGPITGVEAQLAGNAQFPAPIIYAAQGDVVEIRLKNLGVNANPNAPNDPHSVHLHGLDVDAANDGVPETSVGAVPANLCTNGVTAPPGSTCADLGEAPEASAGNVIVYMFTPEFPGTYMYHCHQEADIHVNMGMFGALVVYNPTDPAYLAGFDPVTGLPVAGGGPGQNLGGMLYGAQYDKDYILLLGEFDIRGHADEEGTYVPGGLVPPNTWDPDPYNWANYEPQYWFVNGLSFPNTIHTDFMSGYTYADWQLAHPGYDPLITGSVSTPNAMWGTPGQKALIRVINMGFETQPMHMHGYHGKVIGSDQRAWDWALAPKSKTNKIGIRPFGSGLEKNTLTIGSGETYDWLIDFGQQSFSSFYPNGTGGIQGTFPGGTQSCIDVAGNPVSSYDPTCVAPAFWEGDTYIQGPEVTGLFSGLVVSTSQYFPFHNHDDYKATNNGVYPGGMFTFLVPTP